ncbi:alpha/beta fold hydrolase [Occultella kanbiaonis]|uniref:alpha/beta fold hydrolase n=1 Tax=Occultella kanbiaonis TaxID=2675754 RepID=UPI0012B7FC7C|nr:alpha/beta fold hydrolase [Occultella kanbiaonis]
MSLTTAGYRIDGHDVREHELKVPLDHTGATPGTIDVFAREIVRDGGSHHPYLVWFQGGPGNRANRPDSIGGWLDRALEDYRVLLLDQRGTGRSTPANRQTLTGDAVAQAQYLSHLRADAIVADAEALRTELIGDAPWTLLGQSFGGFVITAYLSQAPAGIREAMITAGLPGLRTPVEDTYRLTYAATARRNLEYFARHPQDEQTARAVAAHLDGEAEILPTGERLSSRRLRTLGINLGTRTGFDSLHYALESPFTTVNGARRLTDSFLDEVGRALSFAPRPLYAVLHESIYAQGAATGGATQWAAHRVRDEFGEFALDAGPGAPFRFTGEHIYPWQFEEDPALVPLRNTADLLARRADLPALYDPDVLAENTVPVAAAIYHDDMFVPRQTSLATAAAIRGLRPIITNDYQHDGIRVDGRNLLDRLIRTLRR